MTTLDEIVRGAMEGDSQEYISLIQEVCRLLESEQDQVGNLRIEGRLARARPRGDAIVIGDLHGDLESLVSILRTSDFVEKATREAEVLVVFLGDYGDRGPFSPEVYYTVLKLKQLFPRNVMLMRGNHEGPDDLQATPHDLPQSLRVKFGEEGRTAYANLRGLHPYLYSALIVEQFCVMLHGGVPEEAGSPRDLAFAHTQHPRTTTLEEMLWSDPVEGTIGSVSSPRGAGCLFGQDVTQHFLEVCRTNVLIRGHEPADEGFKINHQGRVLTLFSRKGPPYFNTLAAYLHVDLSLKPHNAPALVPYIHQF